MKQYEVEVEHFTTTTSKTTLWVTAPNKRIAEKFGRKVSIEDEDPWPPELFEEVTCDQQDGGKEKTSTRTKVKVVASHKIE